MPWLAIIYFAIMLVLAAVSVVIFATEKKMWSLKIALYEMYDIISLVSLIILSAALWSETLSSHISATVAIFLLAIIIPSDIYFSLTKKAYSPLIDEDDKLSPREIELSGIISLVMMAPAYIMSILSVGRIVLS